MADQLLDIMTNIRAKHGRLDPEVVLDEARDPAHPLYHRFDWDDTSAAEKFRLVQAAKLLRVVKLPPEQRGPADLRAYLAVQTGTSHRADYRPTGEVMEDPFSRKLVLQSMEREWRTLKEKYGRYEEFAAMIANDPLLQEESGHA